MKKCVWCGEQAALVIRIIIDENKESLENAICWSCLYAAAKKRLKEDEEE